MKDIEFEDLITEGLSFMEASRALGAYYSCRIEGTGKLTAKRLAKLIKVKKE